LLYNDAELFQGREANKQCIISHRLATDKEHTQVV